MSVKLENASYTYAPNTPFESVALADASLTIEDGEFVAVMGRTGCGKSTLLKLIDGLVKPTQGKVYLDGCDINDRHFKKSILREKIGVVFQHPEYQLFDSTVKRDVAFGLKHLGISKKESEERIRWALETVGFDYERVSEKSPFGFSGGEKRRLAIAGVLACKPKILILDEPVAGLDPKGREEFLNLLKVLNDSGTTIIMISHNSDAIAEYANRVIVLDKGRIVADDSTVNIFSDRELMLKYGISAGQVSDIADMLRLKGIAVPSGIIKYDELLAFLKRRGEGML